MNKNIAESEKFRKSVKLAIESYPNDLQWKKESLAWMTSAFRKRYMYNFNALGRPIIQTPVDIVAIQELIWDVQPDLIIETGVAHGGSLIMNASMLALIDMCDAIKNKSINDPNQSKRKVVGIDIDIRSHNRTAIEAHPMASRIQLIEGSSIDPAIIAKVNAIAANHSQVLVCLDSNHTHEHVLAELNAYAPLVSVGSYCVVFDTFIEDMPNEMFPDRPWGPGNSPKTAVWEFLKKHPEYEIDRIIQNKLLLTAAPDGYLKKKE